MPKEISKLHLHLHTCTCNFIILVLAATKRFKSLLQLASTIVLMLSLAALMVGLSVVGLCAVMLVVGFMAGRWFETHVRASRPQSDVWVATRGEVFHREKACGFLKACGRAHLAQVGRNPCSSTCTCTCTASRCMQYD